MVKSDIFIVCNRHRHTSFPNSVETKSLKKIHHRPADHTHGDNFYFLSAPNESSDSGVIRFRFDVIFGLSFGIRGNIVVSYRSL